MIKLLIVVTDVKFSLQTVLRFCDWKMLIKMMEVEIKFRRYK